jgi:hypothetical protein
LRLARGSTTTNEHTSGLSSGQVVHPAGREYLLAKLQEFHRVHKTPIDQLIRDLKESFTWLPKSAYAAEAKPVAELAAKKRRGPQRVGDLLVPPSSG